MENLKKKGIQSGLGWPERITLIGVILLLTVFPLFTWDMYYDILFAKYKFFWITGIGMTVLTLLAVLIERRKSRKRAGGSRHLTLQGCVKQLDKPETAILVFLALYGISTLLSDYKYEAVWGNEGRLCGLFFMCVTVAVYLTIKRKLVFKRWLVDLFLLSSMLVCLWGITDFFKMDLFGFKANISLEDMQIFTSSLGNVNTYTAYVALVTGIAATLFLDAQSTKNIVWYGGCLVISLFAIIMGQSDNAYLALGALFGFLPYYAFQKRGRTVRYFIILALFVTVMQCIAWICGNYREHVIEFSGIFDVLAGGAKLLPIALVLWAVSAGLWLATRGKEAQWQRTIWKKLRAGWTILLAIAVLVILFLLYDANTSPDPQKYGALRSYLVLDDDWGTHRMHNWKIGMRNYKEFSLIHKIFGYGPETYGILTVSNNFDEMVSMYNEKYDNAHNEYLQYFFTIGPVGLVAYLSVLFFSFRQIFTKALDNPYAVALAFAVICYAVQAAVNIATPIVYPFVWLFLAMGLAAGKGIDTSEKV